MHDVADSCGKVADLHFLSKDISRPEFRRQADDVILVVKFLSHAWEDAAVQHFGAAHVHRHRGGLSTLKDLIRRLAQAA